MPEFKTMRRLSVYFTGDTALTLTLEPGDTLSRTPNALIIKGKLNETSTYEREILREHIAHTFLVTYQMEVTEPQQRDPEVIEPEGELR